jgi:hypothetical protein
MIRIVKHWLRLTPYWLWVPLAACGPKSEDARDETNDPEAGGGQGGESSREPELVCPDPNETIDPTAVVDDLEDQNGKLLPVNGRSGGWWTAGDDTLGATVVPAPAELTGLEATPEAIPGGRCNSAFAMRVTGQGFTDWGAVLGISLAYGKRPNGLDGSVPYDASARTGVDFWARIGDTSTNQVRFAVGDGHSEPDGGHCVEDGDIGEECYDTFGVYLTQLDTNWHHYRIPFAGLGQRDFGYKADAVATAELYTLLFNFDPGAVFDFWIDDISFY